MTAIEFENVGKQYRLGLLESVGTVVKQFDTGDRPVLICCSDMNYYLCKYNRFGGAAYSLAREYTGTVLASVWGLMTDRQSLVRIHPEHLQRDILIGDTSGLCLGRRWINNVADINEMSQFILPRTREVFEDFLKIALFDLWLCNEDRTANNLNLLFDLQTRRVLPIDHAGVFNTSFSAPLIQLGFYDSLMYSRVFLDYYNLFGSTYDLNNLFSFFEDVIEKCKNVAEDIVAAIPELWKIDECQHRMILDFILSEEWCARTWDNFKDMLNMV